MIDCEDCEIIVIIDRFCTPGYFALCKAAIAASRPLRVNKKDIKYYIQSW